MIIRRNSQEGGSVLGKGIKFITPKWSKIYSYCALFSWTVANRLYSKLHS